MIILSLYLAMYSSARVPCMFSGLNSNGSVYLRTPDYNSLEHTLNLSSEERTSKYVIKETKAMTQSGPRCFTYAFEALCFSRVTSPSYEKMFLIDSLLGFTGPTHRVVFKGLCFKEVLSEDITDNFVVMKDDIISNPALAALISCSVKRIEAYQNKCIISRCYYLQNLFIDDKKSPNNTFKIHHNQSPTHHDLFIASIQVVSKDDYTMIMRGQEEQKITLEIDGIWIPSDEVKYAPAMLVDRIRGLPTELSELIGSFIYDGSLDNTIKHLQRFHKVYATVKLAEAEEIPKSKRHKARR